MHHSSGDSISLQDVYSQSSMNGEHLPSQKMAVRRVLQGSQDANHWWHTQPAFKLMGITRFPTLLQPHWAPSSAVCLARSNCTLPPALAVMPLHDPHSLLHTQQGTSDSSSTSRTSLPGKLRLAPHAPIALTGTRLNH